MRADNKLKTAVPLGQAEFLSEKFNDKARLLFVDDANIAGIAANIRFGGSNRNILVNHNKLSDLRNLKAGDICLVSKARLMRGFDYRCEQGIALLLS